jgi:hypothetical protein
MEDTGIENSDLQISDVQKSDFETKYAYLALIREAREELGDALNQSDHYKGRKRFWGFLQIPTEGVTGVGLALLHTQNPQYSVIGLLLATGGAAASAFAAERFLRARNNEEHANYTVAEKRHALNEIKKERDIK